MPDPLDYSAYGLRLRSEIPLDPLRVSLDGKPDIIVRRATHRCDRDFPIPVYATAGTTAAGTPYLAVDAADHAHSRLRICHNGDRGMVEFLLTAGEVHIHVEGTIEPGDLRAYFNGPVLGYLLRLRRTPALHGGFVATPRGAVGVIGPKGAGKSSLVAAWARAGIPVLADDIGALHKDLEGRWTVASGYPRLRLWPDSATALGLPASADRVLSSIEKIYADLTHPPFAFEPSPTPLRAIVALAPRGGAEPAMEQLGRGGAAIAPLLANIYAPAAGGAGARARDLAALADLSGTVPIVAVTLPDRFEWLRNESVGLLDRLPM